MASSILLSGNNREKINLMLKFSNIGIINETFFLAIQRHHVIPVVNKTFNNMLEQTMIRLQGKELVLSGEHY